MELIAFFIITVLTTAVAARYVRPQCEPVKSLICYNLDKEGYSMTSFPNFLNHTSQEEAIFDLNKYRPLIELQNRPQLTLFVCSVFIPLCADGIGKVPPCQSLCEKAKESVEGILRAEGMEWPFDCSKYPMEGKGKLCISHGLQSKKEASNRKELNEIYQKNYQTFHQNLPKKVVHIIAKKQETVNLYCNPGTKILLRKVHHRPKRIECCPSTSKALVAHACDGKRECTIDIARRLFGSKCFDQMKNVALKYRCVPLSQEMHLQRLPAIPFCKHETVQSNNFL